MSRGRAPSPVLILALTLALSGCKKGGPEKHELKIKEYLLTLCRYDRTPLLDPDLDLVSLRRQADVRVVDVPLLIQTRRGVRSTSLAHMQADLQLSRARRPRPRYRRLRSLADHRRLTKELEELRTASDTLRQRKGPATRIHLAIAPEVSARAVIRALEAAYAAGFREASFLFTPTRFRRAQPHDRKTYEEILNFKKSRKKGWQETASLHLARKHAKGCSQAAEVLKALRHQARQERCAYLLRDLPGALRKCGYQNETALLSGVVALFSKPTRGLVATRVVTLKPMQKGFQVKKNARWKDIAPRAAELHSREFWFSVQKH